MRKLLFNCLGLGLILSVACGVEQSTTHEEATEADSAYYTLPGMDHGIIQSPVNILTKQLGDVQGKDIMVYGDMHPSADAIINKGHTIELEFNHETYVRYDDKEFNFHQAHFHTPSEHLVDGITFPMEMHMVNVRENNQEDVTEYLVIAAMFKMGDENPFIQSFIDRIPTEESDTLDIADDPVTLDDLLGTARTPDEEHYYSYKGSLTTPPYSETVNWLIFRKIFEASPEQIRYINELEGNNARHVQALYGRKVGAN